MYTFQKENTNFVRILSSRKPYAVAYIKGSDTYPSVAGRVLFYPAGERGVLAVTSVRGLPVTEMDCAARVFAMHIHENGTCSGTANDPFQDTGSHYNPYGCPHPAHAGDLAPLFATARGNAWNITLYDRFGIAEIIGKSVIIHRNPDNFTTQPAGAAGEKIACGTVVKHIFHR